MAQKKTVRLFIFIFCIILSIITLLPLFLMLLTSVKSISEINAEQFIFIPEKILFSNYAEAMQKGDWIIYFKNTVIVTGITVTVSLVINSLAGYAFARIPFKGRDVLFFPTMKTLEPKRAENKAEKAAVNGSAEDATVSAPSVQIDLSKVKIEPLFADDVDFETFSKSDFRVVKIEACEAVPKSKKLLKFTLNDGTDRKRTILSGIHEYYEPEELVGKTCVAITNLPPRKMMGIDSEGMLISAVYEYDGREGLNLLMLDDSIPAGAKLY